MKWRKTFRFVILSGNIKKKNFHFFGGLLTTNSFHFVFDRLIGFHYYEIILRQILKNKP